MVMMLHFELHLFFWLEEIEAAVKGSSEENLDWWEIWISLMLVFVCFYFRYTKSITEL